MQATFDASNWSNYESDWVSHIAHSGFFSSTSMDRIAAICLIAKNVGAVSLRGAAENPKQASMSLTQFEDTAGCYTKLCVWLQREQPKLLLFPALPLSNESLDESTPSLKSGHTLEMINACAGALPGASIHFVPRHFWNETSGLALLEEAFDKSEAGAALDSILDSPCWEAFEQSTHLCHAAVNAVQELGNALVVHSAAHQNAPLLHTPFILTKLYYDLDATTHWSQHTALSPIGSPLGSAWEELMAIPAVADMMASPPRMTVTQQPDMTVDDEWVLVSRLSDEGW